ncbi:MAG: FAD-linked oxidase C-terminal domain-containing protein [Bacteroidota bacterium]|nr:FAD-linked oxidase C-terminal domain-containing protein [Bacteroidota bacterium]
MEYKKVSEANQSYFIEILGSAYVQTDDENLQKHGRDHTEDLLFVPEIVLKPGNTQEVSKVLAYCNQHLIPVTARGAGTGLSGGALPIKGGVSLSMERFNQINYIDEKNFQVSVQPGVINEVLQQAVKEKGLFYPPDPASKGSCFLGGNVSLSSGGPRAVKYGTTRDYVLNLEVVLANGEVIITGANTLKYATGYNLTHLMIGSEGTLGIVTNMVLKLIPAPKNTLLLLAPFASPEQACEAVNAIFLAGCNPSACEFVEPDGFRLAANLLQISFDIQPEVQAYLLIEVDGNHMEYLMKEVETISEVLYNLQAIDVLFAETAAQKEYFWKLRRSIGEATKHNNTYKEEDTVVPRGTLPELFKGVKEIGARYGFRSVCYGHAGDGNLHVNILKDDLSEEFWNHTLDAAIIEIFTLCKKLGGTISGEHGIGLVQQKFMPVVMPAANLELMKAIKLAFDPNQILNPGKVYNA